MAEQWALRMPRSGLSSAGALRLRKIDVCLRGNAVWMRGAEPAQEFQNALHALPAAERFDIGAGGVLMPAGHRVPVARLPDGPWVALADALRVEAQTAVLPGLAPKPVEVQLVRSAHELESNVTIVSAEAWRSFALEASVLRLKGLRFALSETRALIWGRPVPSIPGARYAESGGIAIPAGFVLYPIGDTDVLRTALGLKEGDLAVFQEDGSFELIESVLFAAATRSAVRMSF